MNPLGPLAYAWRISDKACHAIEEQRGLRKGLYNEPTGAGPEWYMGRIGLGLVYLASGQSFPLIQEILADGQNRIYYNLLARIR